jgi:2-keto-4-pentenoate hydratase
MPDWERGHDVYDEQLVTAFEEARLCGVAGPGATAAGYDHHEALGLQLAVLDRLVAVGDRLAGWKVGLTSGPRRDVMGEGFRPFGYLLQSRTLGSGDLLGPDRITSCYLEPELCLVLGAPLRGDQIDPAAARSAVRAIVPAFELNERRLAAQADDATTIADGLGNWGIVVGPETPVRSALTKTTVELWHNDTRVATRTPGDSMDDPFLSLSRLCALLHWYGRGLEAGQYVITGSFCNQDVQGPGTWRAVFSGIGDVTARFA